MHRDLEFDAYLYSPHEVPVWAPILPLLRSRGLDARFVLEPPGRNVAVGSVSDPTRGWFDDKAGTVVRLVDRTTADTIEGLLRDSGESAVPRRRLRASAGTTQSLPFVRRYAGPRTRMPYGVAFMEGAYGHGRVNGGFDCVLAHGPFSRARIRAACPDASVQVVGFPKWAAVRRGEMNRARARLSLGLPDQPIVAWLPTWAHRSSLAVASSLLSLDPRLLLVMKPHHNTARFERARLDGLPSRVTVLSPTASLVHLLVAADAVVADVASGGFTEGLLADRPVVGVRSAFEQGIHPGAAESAHVCTDPAELAQMVDVAIGSDPFAEGRRHWVPELFGDTAGMDADLAADAIAQVAVQTGNRIRRMSQAVVESAVHLARSRWS